MAVEERKEGWGGGVEGGGGNTEANRGGRGRALTYTRTREGRGSSLGGTRTVDALCEERKRGE